MTLDDIPSGTSIFVDANNFVYFFGSDVILAPSCARLMSKIKSGDFSAITSTHVLTETAHRLMTFEASQRFGWKSKIVQRLKANPANICALTKFRQALEIIPLCGVRVQQITPDLVPAAATISQQYGLLSNDALTIAVMQANSLSNLASHDSDFDRVPTMTRFGPV